MKLLLWVFLGIMVLMMAVALLRGIDRNSNSEQNSPHSLQTDPPN